MIEFTNIPLDKQNRMLRLGFGKNKGVYFTRIDLWFIGYRINLINQNKESK